MKRYINLALFRNPSLFQNVSILNLNSPSIDLDFIERLGDMKARIVFCDGGYTRSFRKLDRRNKKVCIVGDFDSICADTRKEIDELIDVDILQIENQDMNDLQKGLNTIVDIITFEQKSRQEIIDPNSMLDKKEVDHVIINGITGDRMDHQM